MNNIELLKRELLINGISCLGENVITFHEDGKKYKSKIQTKRNLIKSKYEKNIDLIKEVLLECSCCLSSKECSRKMIDINQQNMFIYGLKNLFDLIGVLVEFTCLRDFIIENKIYDMVKMSLNKDVFEFDKNDIESFNNNKVVLDWMYRRNEKLIYIDRLLCVLQKKQPYINDFIKEARGIQGPWGNLDLPVLERVFEWDDVEEETRGRERDKQKQYRYRLGLEDYHSTGKFGEGFYWREHRNEPYSWENRYQDSPYPQLKPGTWR